MSNKKLLFVTFQGMLREDRQGGVQVCTFEYLEIFRNMGYEIEFCIVPLSGGRLRTLIRKSGIDPYNVVSPRLALPRILEHPWFREADVIALNHADLDALAKGLRQVMADKQKLILCSHGNKSTDLGPAIDYPQSKKSCLNSFLYIARIGRLLQLERRSREWYDVVLCLSEMDAVIDKWLGARETYATDRTVSGEPLRWEPVENRVGFFGTIDHPPTLASLIQIAEIAELEDSGSELPRVRLVGSPDDAYNRYLSKYRIFEYLGYMSNEALRDEARTWSLALHPLFSWPMGASMKLATMISYEIPILSTPGGLRGYPYAEPYIPVAATVGEFIKKMTQIAGSPDMAKNVQEGVSMARNSAPTASDVASSLLRQGIL